NNTFFWSDTWKGEVPFRDAFPRLFALETGKNVCVADKLVAGVVSSFRRPVQGDREQQQWLDLALILATVSLSSVGDRWTCNLSGDDSFRVRDVCNYIDAIFLPSSSEQWGSFSDWNLWFSTIRLKSKVKSLLEGVFNVAWWSIWVFRNRVVFYGSTPSRSLIFDDIVDNSFH
nr:RNA-directed DNA polymerase, eukaryota [Tanacetum cinerariifolium]